MESKLLIQAVPQSLPILFAESPVATILFGILILFVALLLRRAGAKRRKSADGNSADDVRKHFLTAEQTGRREIEKLELRLHEFAREIDALTQTRIAVLTELVSAADRVIAELEERTTAGELTAEQRRMVSLLSQAGYRPVEIATLIGRDAEAVRGVVENETRGESRAA